MSEASDFQMCEGGYKHSADIWRILAAHDCNAISGAGIVTIIDETY